MTIQEQIAPEIVQAIIAQATVRGVSLNDYLREVFGLANVMPTAERPFYETATPDEWIAEFTRWADSHDPQVPALPLEAVSRDSIYEDR